MRLTCSFFLFQQSDHIPDLGAPSMARTLASVFEVLAKMTPNVLSVQRNGTEDFG